MEPSVKAFWTRMQGCAQAMGRELAPPGDKYASRLDERDAEQVERGFHLGLLRIIKGRYVQTLDPFQATAWLVEGDPAHLCWEYLPHMAAYVDLLDRQKYPSTAVRFETPDVELRLDIAVLDADGSVQVLGEVKVEGRQLASLERTVQEFSGDPGEPAPASVSGPRGSRREAWKLCHQLWATRAPYLWLVAAGVRRTFAVDYRERIVLTPVDSLPSPVHLWPMGSPLETPRVSIR